MSFAAAHYQKFFDEIGETGIVWTICDDTGFPTSTSQSNKPAMPFWSSEARAQRIIETVPSYRRFGTHRLSLEVFRDRWLEGLEKDSIRVGINWSGERATGFDVEPSDVRRRLTIGA
ncbi:DUF2750 domain-containing protein [Sinorhizobium arboris]|uniref:DUF2750 domain-containing protein n=1 Tax=Sinorhizobium arboris TaxID=76745 RepID=UPI000486C7DC